MTALQIIECFFLPSHVLISKAIKQKKINKKKNYLIITWISYHLLSRWPMMSFLVKNRNIKRYPTFNKQTEKIEANLGYEK